MAKKIDLNKLNFDATSHQYRVNGDNIISVTQLLVKVGIVPPIPDYLIGSEKLKQASEYGTMVHQQIEELVKTGSYVYRGMNKPLPTADFIFFRDKIYPLCTNWQAETRFYTPDYAGCCDLFGLEATDPETLIMIDHKTGTSWTSEAVSWQLFLYYKGLQYCNLLPEHKGVKYYCNNLKGNNSELVKIDPPTEEEYNKLLDCLSNGTVYTREIMSMPVDRFKKAIEILQDMPLFKALEKKIKEFTAELKDYCTINGINEISVQAKDENEKEGIYRWYFTKPSTRKEFNEEQFKKDYPELYAQYVFEKKGSQAFRSEWVKKKEV